MTGAVLDLAGLGSQVEWTDAQSASDARASAGPGALDALDSLREWLAATSFRSPPSAPRRPVCIVAGEATARARAVAEQVGGSLDTLDVPEDEDTAAAAFDRGVGAADAHVDAGCDLLIVADADPSPAPALLVSVLLGLEPVALLPRGAGAVDTDRWIARAEALRDQRRNVIGLRSRHGELMDALGRPSLAATTGLIMRAVSRRTPVVLEGAGAAAAALLCHDVQARAGRWWRFADRSPDPVHTKVVDELAAQPILDLGSSSGDGVAGLLTLALIRAATVPNP